MFRKKISFVAAMLLLAVTAWAQGPNNTGRYYQNASGKKGRSLKTAMFSIIKTSHGVGYNTLYEAYFDTDKRNDGKLWDMYSNTTNYRLGKDECHGNYSREGDNYNREHSFPRSWFGGKHEPMNSDVNHIYPTDAWVNGQRGSLPYGEVDTSRSYKGSKNNFSKWGDCKRSIGYSGDVFEPNDEYKGDLARTYFYMATCYEDKIAGWDSPMLNHDKYNAYKSWAIDMLLRWAKEDPVSQKEIDRNNAAYKWQGNRNPFIDYPGLEQYIWGSRVNDSFSYDNYSKPSDNTGIDEIIVNENGNGKTYDIFGREVGEGYRGIVIKNGKKYLVH